MSQRHEQRYKAAVARIKPARVNRVRARVLKQIKNSSPVGMIAVNKLLRHKLGIRAHDPIPGAST